MQPIDRPVLRKTTSMTPSGATFGPWEYQDGAGHWYRSYGGSLVWCARCGVTFHIGWQDDAGHSFCYRCVEVVHEQAAH